MNAPDAFLPVPPRRRWRQFSLRFLLAAMLLAALPLAWVKLKLDQAEAQQPVLKRIRNVGGEVVYEVDHLGKALPALRRWLGPDQVVEVLFNFGPIRDADVAGLEAFPRLKVLELHGTGITDAGLGHVERLTSLEKLDLSFCPVTDHGLTKLQGLTNLRILRLASTRITNAGLVHLTGLTKLESLSLSQCRITDPGLMHLKAFPKLTELDLTGTRITDAGLIHLEGLTDLRTLKVSHRLFPEFSDQPEFSHYRGVTQAGLTRLRQKLPKLPNNKEVIIMFVPPLEYAPRNLPGNPYQL